ncbi:SDR family NAD(P)-dependent oxidoreductase [Sciscionella sediminilitoris]|uniref:SDR family NAD(P)-dependent oxidoreductase n=1 Tax=Sciscionella sediminilitoris TaxID=1445613 RepID=UPI000A88DA07|nr:SDR family NAD(P)-dependent oxidoreductase [Sciscionella sp. SE31]
MRPARLLWRTCAHALNGKPGTNEHQLRKAVSGKTVLITGASYGIGEATARLLAGAGATVLLIARSAKRLDEVTAAIRADGGDAHAYPADLTDTDSVDGLVDRILEAHGQVDVLVNNAGKSIRRSIELSENRFSDFQRTIDINYLGPVKLTLALLPSMRARGAGHVVNVSTWGMRMSPGARWAAYSASKAAFDTWFRTFGKEVRSAGITTTSVYMGLVHTRMSAPTAALRSVPGLSPQEAAGILADAIVTRKLKIEPPFMAPIAIGLYTLRTPVELLSAALYRFGSDSEASIAAVREQEPPQSRVS